MGDDGSREPSTARLTPDQFQHASVQIREVDGADLSMLGAFHALHSAPEDLVTRWKRASVDTVIDAYGSDDLDLDEEVLETVRLELRHTVDDAWSVRYIHGRSMTPAIVTHERALDISTQSEAVLRDELFPAPELDSPRNAFIMASITETIVTMAKTVAESSVTEREFLSYHLSRLYQPETAADLIGQCLNTTSISSGSVRKYRSRAREKYVRSQQTQLLIPSSVDVWAQEAIPEMESVDGSPLTDAQKTQLAESLYERLRTPDETVGSETPHVTPIAGCEVGFNVTSFAVQVNMHYDVAEIPITPTVDVDVAGTPQVTEGSDLTTLGDLGPEYAALRDDLTEIVQALVDAADEDKGLELGAIGAYDERSPYVSFCAVVDR